MQEIYTTDFSFLLSGIGKHLLIELVMIITVVCVGRIKVWAFSEFLPSWFCPLPPRVLRGKRFSGDVMVFVHVRAYSHGYFHFSNYNMIIRLV